MRFLPANLDALLVELDDLAQAQALLAELQVRPMAGIEEMVPAARTLFLRFRPWETSAQALVDALAGRRLDAAARAAGPLVEIPLRYDGEDLDEVAGLLGLSRAEVIAAHTGSTYDVAFVGFAPGFAYLSGGDARLDVPRRRTPRTRVPAGAVALAGRFSAVYPQASPGGWQLIGSTSTPMWDLGRQPAALLQPGARVRFVDRTQDAPLVSLPPAHTAPPPAQPVTACWLEVVHAGLQAVFQDAGRAGQAGQGVSASGALDQGALRSANRLVGNASDAAVLELVDGGFTLRSHGRTVVAVTGAHGPLTLQAADGRRWPQPRSEAIALDDGDRLTLGPPGAGLRSYLAVRGGFVVEPVLGSCATDTLARLGPAPLQAGDRLAVRDGARGVIGQPEPLRPLPAPGDTVVLDLVLGPRSDWISDEALALLTTQTWTVTPQSNRVGLRLAGARALERVRHDELPSEGTALGAIQVPASGQPVLFLADRPLTGGYPVVGAVASHHLDLAGQIPIGAQIRFHPIRPFAPLQPVRHAQSPDR